LAASYISSHIPVSALNYGFYLLFCCTKLRRMIIRVLYNIFSSILFLFFFHLFFFSFFFFSSRYSTHSLSLCYFLSFAACHSLPLSLRPSRSLSLSLSFLFLSLSHTLPLSLLLLASYEWFHHRCCNVHWSISDKECFRLPPPLTQDSASTRCVCAVCVCCVCAVWCVCALCVCVRALCVWCVCCSSFDIYLSSLPYLYHSLCPSLPPSPPPSLPFSITTSLPILTTPSSLPPSL
jgi:hypothetical protein